MDLAKGRDFQTEIRRELIAEEERHRLSGERVKRLRQYDEYLTAILSDAQPEVNVHAGAPPLPAQVTTVASQEVAINGEPSEDVRSRPEKIEAALEEAGGESTTQEIARWLNERGDGLQFTRHDFWRIVDAALRKGAKHGRFRKVGSARWALAGPGTVSEPKTSPPRQGSGVHPEDPKHRWWWVEQVFRKSGRERMRKPEIVDALHQIGHGTRLGRDQLSNAIHVAMMRRPDKFRRNEDASWSLVEDQSEDLFKIVKD